MFGLLRNFVAPDVLMSKGFKELTDKLSEHFEFKPIIFAEPFHFHKQKTQLQTELTTEFIKKMCRLDT